MIGISIGSPVTLELLASLSANAPSVLRLKINFNRHTPYTELYLFWFNCRRMAIIKELLDGLNSNNYRYLKYEHHYAELRL